MRYVIPIIGILLVIVLIIGTPIVYTIAAYNNTNTYEITITDKEVKKDGESSRYLVFTELGNGEIKVFEVTDAFFAWKFDSSDIYAKLEVGKKYEISTIGFRIPFISAYENIMTAEETK